MYRALLVLLISFPAYAGDFRPHVQILNKISDSSEEMFSGTVFRKTETHNYIITCAHGVGKNDPNLKVRYHNEEYSIATEASLEASDDDLDLAIIKTPAYKTIKVWPIQINSQLAPKGASCVISGYASGTYSIRPVIVNSYKMAYRTSGKEFLVCDGKVEQGMSGCGLIHNGKIFGVLSSDVGKIGPPSIFVVEGGMYVTGEQVATFLKENDHD